MSTWCPSCCANCFSEETHLDTQNKSQFSLIDLLPVGSVFVRLEIEAQQKVCDHRHAQDGWHYFAHETVTHLSDPEEISLCRQINSLVEDRTIVVTYRAAQDSQLGLALRVYLIPSKLVKEGRRRHGVYLLNLLDRLIQSENSWKGYEPTEGVERTPMISDHSVSMLASYLLCHH